MLYKNWKYTFTTRHTNREEGREINKEKHFTAGYMNLPVITSSYHVVLCVVRVNTAFSLRYTMSICFDIAIYWR